MATKEKTYDSFFEELIIRYVSFNREHFHKKSLYYLTAQDLDSATVVAKEKIILSLSQLGILYKTGKNFFVKNRFDDNLLKFFSKFRNRLSFVFIPRYRHLSTDPSLYLVRIVITQTSPEERDEIDNFMAMNIKKYSKYARQTTNYEKNIDDEKIIDLDHMDMVSDLPNKINYKDLILIFGY